MNSCYLDSGNKALCCGCKACSFVCAKKAISFIYDEEGFWYPVIDEEKCIKCNLCRKVCPLNDEKLSVILDKNQTYAAYAKSDDVLLHSASGGMFTVLSDVILSQGGMVFGHVYDTECRVECVSATTIQERDRMCGSKYVQSDMGSIFKDIHDAVKIGKPVLFTGTPCQVDAVKKSFFGKIPENLFTMGIVCHGVPSPKIFSEYIALEEKHSGKKISEVVFRDKSKGWSMPLRKFCYTDGSVVAELLNADAFNNLFQGTDCILRPSCYECRYAGKERIEDITVADFWGIKEKHGEMFNNDKGVSVLLVNTEKGKVLFDSASHSLVAKSVLLEDAQAHNIPLNHPVNPFKLRERVFREYKTHGGEFILKKYMRRRAFMHTFPVRAVRKIFRIMRGLFIK